MGAQQGTEREPSFEEAVGRLEQIVEAMETGSLSLDDCLRQFEQAVALSRYCTEKLAAAERQIHVLTEGRGLEPVAASQWGTVEASRDPFAEA